jgi:hypothetical protein
MIPELVRAGMGLVFVAASVCGQSPAFRPQSPPAPPPLLLPAQGAATAFVEKPWDQLSDKTLAEWGQAAMKSAKSWRHGETRSFVIHYHKLAEAQRAAREAEFYYEYVKKDLLLEKDYDTGKNHLFIFDDRTEWETFLAALNKEYFVSTHKGKEMFVYAPANDQTFSQRLAFPVTNCAFRRYFPKALPYWLRIGLGEFETGNAYKQMKGIAGGSRGSGKRQRARDYPFEKLFAAAEYPSQRTDFIATAERIARILLNDLDRKRFVPLGMKLCEGATFEKTIVEMYPQRFRTFDDFRRLYNSVE